MAQGCTTFGDCGPAPANWPLNGTWAASSTAQWISPFTPDANSLPAAGYEYDFSQTFNLAGIVSGAEIKGNWASDNCTLGIYVNGTLVPGTAGCPVNGGNGAGYATKVPFDLTSGLFNYGAMNTITFKVQNLSSPTPDPSGLLVEITSATGNNTPEPATLFGVGLGLGVVGLAYRRRRS